MKHFLASLALSVLLAGPAFAQMPAGMPTTASAKAAADKASAKATADTTAAKTAADSTTAKAAADGAAVKTDVVGKGKAAGAAAKSSLDLNTASEADLAALPGVGPVNAKKIVDARPFVRKDQLVSKKILTKDDYTKIKDLIIAKKPAKK